MTVPLNEDDDQWENVSAAEVVEVEEQEGHPYKRGNIALNVQLYMYFIVRADVKVKHLLFTDMSVNGLNPRPPGFTDMPIKVGGFLWYSLYDPIYSGTYFVNKKRVQVSRAERWRACKERKGEKRFFYKKFKFSLKDFTIPKKNFI